VKHQTRRVWERRENGKTVKVRRTTNAERWDMESKSFKMRPVTYDTTFRQAEDYVTYEGDFLIEIDVEGIAARMAGQAAHSKQGKATLAHGLIKAKRLSMVETNRERREFPLPADTVLLEAKGETNDKAHSDS
jgi:hypothetical protein